MKTFFKSLGFALTVIGTTNIACAATTYETFDVNFVVLTSNPTANMVATLEQLKEEVNILNTYFVKKDRSSIIKFRFKNATFYKDIKNSGCDFVKLGDTTSKNDIDWTARFNNCSDPLVRDKNAINFYIYDSYTAEKGFNDADSFGVRNSNSPYVAIDWQRLNHNIQSPEEHELGHAFGLSHICVPGATYSSSTNIMASSENCNGASGGKRDIGFDDSQVNTIMRYVPLIKAKLAQSPLKNENVFIYRPSNYVFNPFNDL